MNELHKHLIDIYNELKKEKWKERDEYFSKVAGISSSLYESSNNLQYNTNQIYNTNWGGKGHGIAAEEANTMIDRIQGKKSEIVGRDNAKNGADRIVNGQEIQTKYYKTAIKSVNSAFNNKTNGLYKYYDKNGKPMQLEVPKDQYEKALEHMRTKISEGKVPGVTDPSQANKLVRKGNVTYEESIKITKFGTTESLAFDMVQGAKMGAISGGIATVSTIAQGIINKDDAGTIMKNSLKSGAKSATQATATSVLANQAMRSTIGKIANKNVVTACVATTVLTVEDVYKSFTGEQSFKQTGKNFVKNGAGVGGGMAGAIWGASLGSAIPVVGTLVGGIVGGIVGGMAASKAADIVMTEWLGIKDDVDEMLEMLNKVLYKMQNQYWFSEDEGRILSDILQKSNLRLITETFIKSENKEHFCYNLTEPLMLSITEDRAAKMLISPKDFYEDFKNVKLG